MQVLVMERKAVALHYLHSWFPLNLIASNVPHSQCTRKGFGKQVLVMERRAVVMHYLHTWFPLDLIASVPLDLLLRGRRLDILRLPRLLKIIRMMHYKSFSQAGERQHLLNMHR